MIDAIEREAAAIAQGIAALKSRPYQAEDKALVAEYLSTTQAVGSRSYEITLEALNLPYPVWAVIRKAYLEAAIDWKRETRNVCV